MENSYGIGIANRYELFYDQDDVTDFETVITKKKSKAKEPAVAPVALQQKSAAEKENKLAKKPVSENGQLKTNSEPRKGIKEQQNNSNRDGDSKGISNRPAFNKSGGENREDRNNRRNRELNGTVDFEKPRNPGAGASVGQRNQNRRPFDGRKRERDRQSGSDKTGVKAVDKRDGAGAHNWGSHKQDIDDLNKTATTDDEQKEGGDENVDESAQVAPVEEEPKEMTLDEWKAQRQAQILQPQYNLRKAGEGDDNNAAQFDKMTRLNKKNAENDSNQKLQETVQQKTDSKKKQVLDIEFHFNDNARRGGMGRRQGPPRSGGQRQDRERRPRVPRDNAEGGAGGNRRGRFENRGRGDNAPKVDDERDFPSLG